MRRSSPRRLGTQPQPSMPLSAITMASASSHSTHRAALQPFYGRQTAVSLCVEGAPRWSPTPTRASASSAADRKQRAISALGRQRAAPAHIALAGSARGTSSALPLPGTARTRRHSCAHRRRTCISCTASIEEVARLRPDVKNATSGVTLGSARLHGHRPSGRQGWQAPAASKIA